MFYHPLQSERKVRSAQANALEQERAREREEEEHRDSLVQLSSTITGLEERVTILVHQEQAARYVREEMGSLRQEPVSGSGYPVLTRVSR